MKGLGKEIFLASLDLFGKFFTEFGAKAEEFKADLIEDRLAACDKKAREVIRMILNLIKTLDPDKEKEVNFFFFFLLKPIIIGFDPY